MELICFSKPTLQFNPTAHFGFLYKILKNKDLFTVPAVEVRCYLAMILL